MRWLMVLLYNWCRSHHQDHWILGQQIIRCGHCGIIWERITSEEANEIDGAEAPKEKQS